MNSQIFSFDGHEVDSITLGHSTLKNSEVLVGPFTIQYRHYDPTLHLTFSLKKLDLYFYRLAPHGKNLLPIYSNHRDSVRLLKQRLCLRDKLPPKSVTIHFNGQALEEYKHVLDDRGLMEEPTLESYGIPPGSTLEITLS